MLVYVCGVKCWIWVDKRRVQSSVSVPRFQHRSSAPRSTASLSIARYSQTTQVPVHGQLLRGLWQPLPQSHGARRPATTTAGRSPVLQFWQYSHQALLYFTNTNVFKIHTLYYKYLRLLIKSHLFSSYSSIVDHFSTVYYLILLLTQFFRYRTAFNNMSIFDFIVINVS